MIERLLENWLDKANERSFQTPFCHALSNEGYTILHMSRHCAMEMGKDIIAIAPDGVPCAFQLKGADKGKIGIAKWRDDISKQIWPLTMGKIVHPSLDSDTPHRSFLVTNGLLEEEVIREIDDWNRARDSDGQPERRLHTIVRDQMLGMFRSLERDFWPSQPSDARTILEIFLDEGQGLFPKEKLASLFSSILPFETEDAKPPKAVQCSRALASAAVLCALVTSSFTHNNNHSAEFEAWTLYFCYILALAEKWKLPRSSWEYEATLASEAMYNALARLCDEAKERDIYVQGDPFVDRWVYEARMTSLYGLLSIYGLWRKFRQTSGTDFEDNEAHEEFLVRFCRDRQPNLGLWGEYAIPQIIAFYLFRRRIDGTPASEAILRQAIIRVVACNQPKSNKPLPSPYYNADAGLPYALGLDNSKINDNFNGSSYTIESLLHLYVRCLWKQDLRTIWPEITRIIFLSFLPTPSWKYYLWNSDTGQNLAVVPQRTQQWRELREQSNEHEGSDLPEIIKRYPVQLLCFLVIAPHRLTPSGVRWLASNI